MRILVVGAGGVGSAVAAVARRRRFFERMTLADLDPRRAEAAVAPLAGDRFAPAPAPASVDAADEASLATAIAESGADAVLNATDPRFNPQIFAAAFEAGCTYLDM